MFSFVPPDTNVPAERIRAAGRITFMITLRDELISKYRAQFQDFWSLSNAEINAELDEMDKQQPGQSIAFFGACRELVEFLHSVSGPHLGPDEFKAPRQLAYVDSYGGYTNDLARAVAIRVVDEGAS